MFYIGNSNLVAYLIIFLLMFKHTFNNYAISIYAYIKTNDLTMRLMHLLTGCTCASATELHKVNLHTHRMLLLDAYSAIPACNSRSLMAPFILDWPLIFWPNPRYVSLPRRPADRVQTRLLPDVLTAVNVRLDQMLPHQSGAISGRGVLIGRIYRLCLHGPSSLNWAIDLGPGHGGLEVGRGGGVVDGEGGG